ncbi:hypothetical protein ACW2Q0_18960 [Nocardia sp. R16R-3T]
MTSVNHPGDPIRVPADDPATLADVVVLWRKEFPDLELGPIVDTLEAYAEAPRDATLAAVREAFEAQRAASRVSTLSAEEAREQIGVRHIGRLLRLRATGEVVGTLHTPTGRSLVVAPLDPESDWLFYAPADVELVPGPGGDAAADEDGNPFSRALGHVAEIRAQEGCERVVVSAESLARYIEGLPTERAV